MSARRVPTLGRVLAASLAGAALAAAGTDRALALARQYADLPALPLRLGVYALLFAAGYKVCALAARHVSISRKPAGMEKAHGAVPVLSRAVLALLVFCAPLFWAALGERTATPQSLTRIITAAGAPAEAQDGMGYRENERGALDRLVGEKAAP